MKPVFGRKAPLAVFLLTALVTTSLAPVAAVEGWQVKVDASVLTAAQNGATEFIVYMKAKADLTDAKLLGSKVAKGTFVYQALTETARASQGPVLQLLSSAGRPAQSFWITNAIVTSGDLSVVEAVASLSDVQAVYAVGKGELQRPIESKTTATGDAAALVVGPSISHVNADDAWALGYKGQGVVVAGADTGVRWTHEAIKSKYRGWNGTTADHDYNWRNGAGPNASCPTDTASAAPCDDHSHGTHTVGTMVGGVDGTIPNSGNPPQGKQIGMAPDAEWIACRNMSQGFGAVPTYLDCMQWFIAPTKLDGTSPDPSKAPDVVNNSWGCVEACAPPILRDIAAASRAAGIIYVVSAGNDNQFFFGLTMACNTINFPLAVYDSVFTVGATERTSDSIAYFSSLGPVSDNFRDGVLYKKPDIVAPGVDIWSATATSDNSYEPFGGTSMAGPHVAGLVALILSANPQLKGHVETVERIIRQSAVKLPSDRGCGGDTNIEVPNNEFGWGRIDAVAAVQLALETNAPIPEGDRTGEPLDPAHNTPIPCELISSVGAAPRSAKNIAHVANVCEFVGTDLEFQSRKDEHGVVHDYVFVGTMGAGTRIFDVSDPRLPRFVGAYTDPGWQNDVSLFGDTMIVAFDPLGGPIHVSDCLKQKGATSTRGGVDVINLRFDPALAALKAPLTFQTERIGCYLNNVGGGAHTITVHPSGQWLSVNTSTTGIEVVDLRANALTMVRKIDAAVADDAHDVSFSGDGNLMYVAGISSTRIVDVSDIFNTAVAPPVVANIPNNPPADRGGDGRVIAISHQSDTTGDGKVLIVTDEKGGGLSQTQCNTNATAADPIGGASLWALEELAGITKSSGASLQQPMKIGTWIYPNPTLGVDPLDEALAGIGRQERACTIHVFRAGGNGAFGPATAGQGADGNDGVSRLPVNEIVSAHYGAGVWHVDVMAAPGSDESPKTTWGKTLGWSVMPGAETWSAKEYKGYIYAGDMIRGLDVYTFKPGCEGVACVEHAPDETDTDDPPGDPPANCIPDNVYFLGVVYDSALREDFIADVGNFEYYLASLRKTYCIPDDQAEILAMQKDAQGNNWTYQANGKSYNEGSEANVYAEIQRMGALANADEDATFFFFLSSHGIAYTSAGWANTGGHRPSECPVDRAIGSLSALKAGGGETGYFFDCELGDALNTHFDPETRIFVAVDCSICGGFSDSLTPVSGTVPDNSVPASAGVVGPNRIVVTGCAITTECFGDGDSARGGVTFGHMRDVLEGDHTCDGWTGPAFPTLQGFDVPIQNGPRDGRCTASEWFYAAVDSALFSGDPIAVQQQFRMKYGMGSLANDIVILGKPGPRPAILRPDACTIAPFHDVSTEHPFCPEINWMKVQGLSNGFDDGTFRPAADITRQAMAAFLARLSGADTPACTERPFTDVPVEHPFCKEIKWMKAAGISTGFHDGTYRPSTNVTRQAMAAFLARVVDADTTACTEPPFSDVPSNHPFCAEISWLKDSGITSGFDDGTFRPSINVTRQAMAAFLYRTSRLL